MRRFDDDDWSTWGCWASFAAIWVCGLLGTITGCPAFAVGIMAGLLYLFIFITQGD